MSNTENDQNLAERVVKIRNNANCQSDGSSLKGSVLTKYEYLVKAFGEPTSVAGGDKTHIEWNLEITTESSFTVIVDIYDWKLDEPNYGQYAWHIGHARTEPLACYGEILIDKVVFIVQGIVANVEVGNPVQYNIIMGNEEEEKTEGEPEPEPESCVDNMAPEPEQMSMLVFDNKHLLSNGAVATYQPIFLQHEKDRLKKKTESESPLFKIEYVSRSTLIENQFPNRDDSDFDEDYFPPIVKELGGGFHPGLKPKFKVLWLRGKTGFCAHQKNKISATLDLGVIPLADMQCKVPYWGKGCHLENYDTFGATLFKTTIVILNIERYS